MGLGGGGCDTLAELELSMLQARQNEDTKAPGGKIQEEPSFQHGLPGDRGGGQQKMAGPRLQ